MGQMGGANPVEDGSPSHYTRRLGLLPGCPHHPAPFRINCLHQVVATYRLGLPPVLREVSFHLPAGTSCGLVGRTGSGKSSLMLALFRLISVDAGRVLLDGVDVADIGLDSLRRQLAIIPQVPDDEMVPLTTLATPQGPQ